MRCDDSGRADAGRRGYRDGTVKEHPTKAADDIAKPGQAAMPSAVGSEQRQLARVGKGRCLGAEQAMDLGERVDLAGVRGPPVLGEAQGAGRQLDGVAEVLEFVVQFVAVVREVVLQALEQIRREEGSVARRIAVE